MSDLALVRATHDAMALVHERVMGFHLLEPRARRKHDDTSHDGATINGPGRPSRGRPTAGRGHIPSLPRPNFLSAIVEFTLGE